MTALRFYIKNKNNQQIVLARHVKTKNTDSPSHAHLVLIKEFVAGYYCDLSFKRRLALFVCSDYK